MAAVIPILAAPAGAATTECKGGQYPNRFGAESKITVDCTSAALVKSDNITIHDGNEAVWHHGAARTVTAACSSAACKAQKPDAVWPASTAAVSHVGSPIIKIQSLAAATVSKNEVLPSASDIGRPISASFGTSGKTAVLAGGAYIVAVTAFTGGVKVTTSQNALLSEAAITVKIEDTTSRVLLHPGCAAASTTLTAPTVPAGQHFQPSDLGKSVSGGSIPAGDFISAPPGVNSSTATLNVAANGTCASTALVEVGAAQYSGTVPVWNTTDPMGLHLSNTNIGGIGFTCPTATPAGSKIAMTADSYNKTGGFVTADIGLNVSIRTITISGLTTTTKVHSLGRITAVSTTAPTTATLTSATATATNPAPCTLVVTPTASAFQSAAIGVPGASAPANNDAMMTLGAELNLSPGLVPTSDACADGTLEGFMVVGGWENPGSGYATNASTPTASVGEINFPTSVVQFDGWVVPQRDNVTPETLLSYTSTGSHYTFAFPSLPTTLAECLSGAVPQSPTGLEFTINPLTEAKAPFVPTGSGNISDPGVRSLLPQTASPNIIVEQEIQNSPLTENSKNTTTCTELGLTADPILGTGSGCPTT